MYPGGYGDVVQRENVRFATGRSGVQIPSSPPKDTTQLLCVKHNATAVACFKALFDNRGKPDLEVVPSDMADLFMGMQRMSRQR
jgi:hypothetical protein